MKGTPIQRLMARVVYAPGPRPTMCWVCALSGNGDGYAVISLTVGRRALGHRFSYEYFIGPIPEGLDLDHLCRVRNCVNPDHLEAVTRRVNLLRGNSPVWVTHRTDICKHGHSRANAYVDPMGRRRCRTCIDEHNVRYAAARRELRRTS